MQRRPSAKPPNKQSQMLRKAEGLASNIQPSQRFVDLESLTHRFAALDAKSGAFCTIEYTAHANGLRTIV
eukprot:6192661-Pleurochrysis_carterae.AAC.1